MGIKILNRYTGEVLLELSRNGWDGEARDEFQEILDAARDAQGEVTLLARADFRGAWLDGVFFGDCDLREADFRGVNLEGAYFTNADLRGADFTGANVDMVTFCGAKLEGAIGLPEAPVVPDLDAKILAEIDSGRGELEMATWHGSLCETTHCRAGWAIHLAGSAGYALERKLSAETAGALIYQASTGRVPDFFCGNEEALEDLRACAAKGNAP